MKVLSILIILMLFASSDFAQEHPRFGRSRRLPPKMEELEKVKLLEILQADEETMVRFFSRRKDFMDQIRKLEDSKDDKLDNLSNLLDHEGNSQDIKKNIIEVQNIETEIGQVRSKYIASLTDILNFQQVAKVLIFERNFREELRDLILKERKRRN